MNPVHRDDLSHIEHVNSSNTVEKQNTLCGDLRDVHIVVTSAMMPFIVILNSVLISAVYIFRQLHRTENYLVVAIACFDLLYGVVTIPLYILKFSEVTVFTGNKYGCISMYCLVLIVTIGRGLFLQWLTFDRYTAVMHPFWYQRHVSHGDFNKYAIGVLSTFLVLIGVMPYLGVNEYVEGDDCSVYSIWPEWYEAVFFDLMEGLTALIPFILNIIMFRTVRKQRKRIESTATEKEGPSKAATISPKTSASTSTRVWMSLHFAFLVFYVPTFCSLALRKIVQPDNSECNHLIIFDLITLTWEYGFMGVINPIIMFYLKIDYRKALAKITDTPFWHWDELKHDRLGCEFGTDCTKSSKNSMIRSREISQSKPTCDSDNIIANVHTPTASGISIIIESETHNAEINSPKSKTRDTLGTSLEKRKKKRKSEGSIGSWWSTYIERARCSIKKVVSFNVEDDV